MNFLQLCQEVRRETGIPGLGPTTVIGQTGELGDIVQWVINADLHIQGLYFDWKFMWAEGSKSVSTGNDTVIEPDDYYHPDTETFMLNDGSNKFPIEFIEYREMKQLIKYGLQTEQPYAIARKPTGNFQLSSLPEQDYTLTFDYYKAPVELASNDQNPLIPEKFHRLIVIQAKKYYAEDQEATEIMKYVLPEDDTLMSRLEAAELPNGDQSWTGQNEHNPVVVI